jgi:hypothetical protein
MNKKAGEILERNPEEMIGKHVWTEFPESVDQFLKALISRRRRKLTFIYKSSIVLRSG